MSPRSSRVNSKKKMSPLGSSRDTTVHNNLGVRCEHFHGLLLILDVFYIREFVLGMWTRSKEIRYLNDPLSDAAVVMRDCVAWGMICEMIIRYAMLYACWKKGDKAFLCEFSSNVVWQRFLLWGVLWIQQPSWKPTDYQYFCLYQILVVFVGKLAVLGDSAVLGGQRQLLTPLRVNYGPISFHSNLLFGQKTTLREKIMECINIYCWIRVVWQWLFCGWSTKPGTCSNEQRGFNKIQLDSNAEMLIPWFLMNNLIFALYADWVHAFANVYYQKVYFKAFIASFLWTGLFFTFCPTGQTAYDLTKTKVFYEYGVPVLLSVFGITNIWEKKKYPYLYWPNSYSLEKKKKYEFGILASLCMSYLWYSGILNIWYSGIFGIFGSVCMSRLLNLVFPHRYCKS